MNKISVNIYHSNLKNYEINKVYEITAIKSIGNGSYGYIFLTNAYDVIKLIPENPNESKDDYTDFTEENVIKTYRIKSTRDFSSTFLFMRVIGNTIWLAYSIELNTFLFFISNVISVGSSAFISYYKINDLYNDYKNKNPTSTIGCDETIVYIDYQI